jgi:hypothetical protein
MRTASLKMGERSLSGSIHSRLVAQEFPADVFLSKALVGGEQFADGFATIAQPITQRRGGSFAFPWLAATVGNG